SWQIPLGLRDEPEPAMVVSQLSVSRGIRLLWVQPFVGFQGLLHHLRGFGKPLFPIEFYRLRAQLLGLAVQLLTLFLRQFLGRRAVPVGENRSHGAQQAWNRAQPKECAQATQAVADLAALVAKSRDHGRGSPQESRGNSRYRTDRGQLQKVPQGK